MRETTYRILIAVAIVLWLCLLLLQTKKKSQDQSYAKEALTYKEEVKKRDIQIKHLEARRDTIRDTMIVVQQRWRERIVEVLKEGKNDTIEVPVYIPLQLDSCREVGLLAMERLELAEIQLSRYKDSDTMAAMRIASLEERLNECVRKSEQRKKMLNTALKVGAGAAIIIAIR
jgi:hypothetical protein